MRNYVIASQRTWWITAPQIPGAGSGDAPTRDEAIARTRTRAIEEAAALTRLGYRVQVDGKEEIIDWTLPWWMIPDSLMPTPPGLRDAAVRRMDEIAGEVDRFLDELPSNGWDRDPGDGWTIRRTLDHVAGGFAIGLRRLEPWLLDPDAAQAQALGELIAGVEKAPRDAVEQVGPNQRLARIRWTPRKVVRVALKHQEQWLAHLAGNGAEPAPLVSDDDDVADRERVTAAEIERLRILDQTLRTQAPTNPRVRLIAAWYRYYRDQLVQWPLDERLRWDQMRETFQRRLLALDETELALIRVSPSGQSDTVRMQLGLGLGHVREHFEQMKAAARS